MYYSHVGEIKLFGLSNSEDVIKRIIDELMDEEDSGFQDYKENGYLDLIESTHTSISVEGDGDFDEMDALKSIFTDVIYKVTKIYPECHMKAHFRGTNSSTGDTYIINLEMKDRHVKRIDMDGGEDDIYCPECDEWIISFGDLEFGFDYECDECGYKLSEDEIIEMLNDIDAYNEYDI